MERVPQTTHDTDVNYAVNFNVQKLRENYGEPDAEDESITQIEDFINQMECVADDAQKDINSINSQKVRKNMHLIVFST
ncbi:hypothetical protein [Candidatus Mesenet endosymbiont of Phosphuga atrata]|uniref:hypothetical protein n=1 Tax=Candidatus Mesenet endosymbiont of Phosphuga atrata TaxID=3066221 RepID=UPI0030CC1E9F